MRRGRDRRAIVGKSSNSGQTRFSRTGHRGASHDEGEGEDQAHGPHLTVSGFSVSAFGAVICWSLDNHERFPEFCAKSQKWFRGTEICFVARASNETVSRQYQ